MAVVRPVAVEVSAIDPLFSWQDGGTARWLKRLFVVLIALEFQEAVGMIGGSMHATAQDLGSLLGMLGRSIAHQVFVLWEASKAKEDWTVEKQTDFNTRELTSQGLSLVNPMRIFRSGQETSLSLSSKVLVTVGANTLYVIELLHNRLSEWAFCARGSLINWLQKFRNTDSFSAVLALVNSFIVAIAENSWSRLIEPVLWMADVATNSSAFWLIHSFNFLSGAVDLIFSAAVGKVADLLDSWSIKWYPGFSRSVTKIVTDGNAVLLNAVRTLANMPRLLVRAVELVVITVAKPTTTLMFKVLQFVTSFMLEVLGSIARGGLEAGFMFLRISVDLIVTAVESVAESVDAFMNTKLNILCFARELVQDFHRETRTRVIDVIERIPTTGSSNFTGASRCVPATAEESTPVQQRATPPGKVEGQPWRATFEAFNFLHKAGRCFTCTILKFNSDASQRMTDSVEYLFPEGVQNNQCGNSFVFPSSEENLGKVLRKTFTDLWPHLVGGLRHLTAFGAGLGYELGFSILGTLFEVICNVMQTLTPDMLRPQLLCVFNLMANMIVLPLFVLSLLLEQLTAATLGLARNAITWLATVFSSMVAVTVCLSANILNVGGVTLATSGILNTGFFALGSVPSVLWLLGYWMWISTNLWCVLTKLLSSYWPMSALLGSYFVDFSSASASLATTVVPSLLNTRSAAVIRSAYPVPYATMLGVDAYFGFLLLPILPLLFSLVLELDEEIASVGNALRTFFAGGLDIMGDRPKFADLKAELPRHPYLREFQFPFISYDFIDKNDETDGQLSYVLKLVRRSFGDFYLAAISNLNILGSSSWSAFRVVDFGFKLGIYTFLRPVVRVVHRAAPLFAASLGCGCIDPLQTLGQLKDFYATPNADFDWKPLGTLGQLESTYARRIGVSQPEATSVTVDKEPMKVTENQLDWNMLEMGARLGHALQYALGCHFLYFRKVSCNFLYQPVWWLQYTVGIAIRYYHDLMRLAFPSLSLPATKQESGLHYRTLADFTKHPASTEPPGLIRQIKLELEPLQPLPDGQSDIQSGSLKRLVFASFYKPELKSRAEYVSRHPFRTSRLFMNMLAMKFPKIPEDGLGQSPMLLFTNLGKAIRMIAGHLVRNVKEAAIPVLEKWESFRFELHGDPSMGVEDSSYRERHGADEIRGKSELDEMGLLLRSVCRFMVDGVNEIYGEMLRLLVEPFRPVVVSVVERVESAWSTLCISIRCWLLEGSRQIRVLMRHVVDKVKTGGLRWVAMEALPELSQIIWHFVVIDVSLAISAIVGIGYEALRLFVMSLLLTEDARAGTQAQKDIFWETPAFQKDPHGRYIQDAFWFVIRFKVFKCLLTLYL